MTVVQMRVFSVTSDIFEEKSTELVLLKLKRSSIQSLFEFLIRLKNLSKIGVNGFH